MRNTALLIVISLGLSSIGGLSHAGEVDPVAFRVSIEGELSATVVPGTPSVDVGSVVVLTADEEGAQGWSFSVVSEGPCTLTQYDVAGTASADEDAGGFVDEGFVSITIVDPARNGGRDGIACGVVLSFQRPITLPIGVYDVLHLTVACDTSALLDGDELEHQLSFPLNRADGGSPPESGPLAGNGQPVKLAVTLDGNTLTPDAEGATLRVTAREPQVAPFRRCDANDDQHHDLADAITIVSFLFLGGILSVCPDAADCNDDETLDITDAVFAVDYQFGGGPPPPAPFPDCGLDDDVTEVSCPSGSTSCAV